VTQAEETGHVSRITPAVARSRHALEVTSAAATVGDDPIVVMDMALMTCQLMECTLGSTLAEHP
jgi:hypothetical protein